MKIIRKILEYIGKFFMMVLFYLAADANEKGLQKKKDEVK